MLIYQLSVRLPTMGHLAIHHRFMFTVKDQGFDNIINLWDKDRFELIGRF